MNIYFTFIWACLLLNTNTINEVVSINIEHNGKYQIIQLKRMLKEFLEEFEKQIAFNRVTLYINKHMFCKYFLLLKVIYHISICNNEFNIWSRWPNLLESESLENLRR